MKARRGYSRQFPDSTLSDQRLVQKVFKHHYRGRSQAEIGRALKVPKGTVGAWLCNAERYYPWVDEVAVDRVLKGGDRSVWLNMTVWERRALLQQIVKRWKKDPYDSLDNRPGNAVWTEHWTRLVAEGTCGWNALQGAIKRELDREAA